ncbi:putative GNAT superfamily acetyltransferase [Bacillus ectoiniformans]|uniref:GNAT family N-acetyltransferase n=1 Tax=Bacillus ectoiniformans TaxID=1494429 RepID=UPI001EF92B84|nr:GNAT family N-acetyltransferase [Bacillus ectoiniformans]MBM7647722.1 putative GNAT superfamily acetyltransferase [Bacillus ectoiniformans]
MSISYDIRLFQTYDDFKKMADLERLIWGIEPVPENQTMIAHQNGGLAFGAFHGSDLIGLSYSFPGFANGRSYLCSHNLGIHPDYQKQGIGDALKKTQREEAASLGYDLVTWTYDPLESVNGYLNLTKLKGICRHYIPDCYGDMPDSFSEGMPTDRFKIEWYILEDYLDEPNTWNEEGAKMAAKYQLTAEGLPMMTNVNVEGYPDKWLVPVPKNFQEIRQADTAAALDWKHNFRHIFTHLFSEGYAAVKLIKQADEPVNYYLLAKQCNLPFRLT